MKETRYLHDAELRVDGDEKPKIVGYAAVFNAFSNDLGGFKEYISPGAFTRTLREGADVRALVDHQSNLILGRNKAGTLRLSPNAKGLYVEIDPPDTQAGRDVVESLRRGDVDGMSFAFRTVHDEWHVEDGVPVRQLLDVDLFDVSVVTYPAYPDTEVALRSMQEWTEAREAPTETAETPAETVETPAAAAETVETPAETAETPAETPVETIEAPSETAETSADEPKTEVNSNEPTAEERLRFLERKLRLSTI